MKWIAASGLKLTIILAILVLLITGCGGIGAGSDDSLKEIKEKGVLILGCDDSFPPMGFRNEAGVIVGFDIDLARAVAEKLGVTLEPKPIDWDNKELELLIGNIDVIWNGYTILAERDLQVEFTKPYLNNAQILAVRIDSNINSLDDLAGKIVGCQSSSAAEEALAKDTAFTASLASVRKYNDYQTALLDLQISDRVDAIAGDKILIEYEMTQMPGVFRILDENLSAEYYGVGCRQGSVSLRKAIDKALDELYEDGTIDKISGDWFDSNIVIRDVEKLTQDQLKALEE